jgi:hypothetical protein
MPWDDVTCLPYRHVFLTTVLACVLSMRTPAKPAFLVCAPVANASALLLPQSITLGGHHNADTCREHASCRMCMRAVAGGADSSVAACERRCPALSTVGARELTIVTLTLARVAPCMPTLLSLSL